MASHVLFLFAFWLPFSCFLMGFEVVFMGFPRVSRPPCTPSAVLHEGSVVLRQAVAELGIFGAFLAVGTELRRNEAVGHLVRSKGLDTQQGGVFVGNAVVDVAFLVPKEVLLAPGELRKAWRRRGVKRSAQKRGLRGETLAALGGQRQLAKQIERAFDAMDAAALQIGDGESSSRCLR